MEKVMALALGRDGKVATNAG